jgi:hypothetical protein
MDTIDDDSKDANFENPQKTKFTITQSSILPIFSYNPPNFKTHSTGLIKVGDFIVYEIADEGKFGMALGYMGGLKNNATLDEFIWERYTRDGALRTKHCMQVQVNAYLYKHSAIFKHKYGDAYKKLMAENSFVCVDDINATCDSCVHL